MEATLGEIKGALSVLVPVIQSTQTDQAVMRADIVRVEGRLAELPTTIGHIPPSKPAA